MESPCKARKHLLDKLGSQARHFFPQHPKVFGLFIYIFLRLYIGPLSYTQKEHVGARLFCVDADSLNLGSFYKKLKHFAVLIYQVQDFVNGYNLLHKMGFSPNMVAEALLLFDRHRQRFGTLCQRSILSSRKRCCVFQQ